MATEIKLPQLSDTMFSGKIATWLKKEGDAIERGDILAEVETDKATLQIESFQKGTLLKVLVPAGTTAKVGEVIAYLGKPGESVAVTTPPAPAAQAPATNSAPTTAATSRTPEPPRITPPPPAPTSGRLKASPLARKLAQEKNINLHMVQGTGPEGRIVARDIGSSLPSSSVPPSPVASARNVIPAALNEPSTITAAPPGGRLTPFTKMRETIARRMQESVTTAPHFYATTAVCMDDVRKLREALKERPEFAGCTFTHFIMKAVAIALRAEPRVNRAVKDGQLYEPGQINIGIITAVDDGLLIPVIRDADRLPLQALIGEAKAAVERARTGRPNATDLLGGTFSISNLGMFDVESFTAIINPGQGAVLAVSAIREEVIARNGQMQIASMMRATISVDHRVIDGIMAGTFLKHFKQALEIPALLMV